MADSRDRSLTEFLEKVRDAENGMRQHITRLEQEKTELCDREAELRRRVKELELDASRARARAEEVDEDDEPRSVSAVKREFEDNIHNLQREKDRAIQEAEAARKAFDAKSSRIQELRSQIWDLERALAEATTFVSNIEEQTRKVQKLADQIEQKSRVTLERAAAVESRFEQTAKIVQALTEIHKSYASKLQALTDRNAALDLDLKLKEVRVKKQEERIEQLEREASGWAANADVAQKLVAQSRADLEHTKHQLETEKRENEKLRAHAADSARAVATATQSIGAANQKISELMSFNEQQRLHFAAQIDVLQQRLIEVSSSPPPLVEPSNREKMLQDQIQQLCAREIAYQQELQQQQALIEELRRSAAESRLQHEVAAAEYTRTTKELSQKLQSAQQDLLEVRKKLAARVVQAAAASQKSQPDSLMDVSRSTLAPPRQPQQPVIQAPTAAIPSTAFDSTKPRKTTKFVVTETGEMISETVPPPPKPQQSAVQTAAQGPTLRRILFLDDEDPSSLDSSAPASSASRSVPSAPAPTTKKAVPGGKKTAATGGAPPKTADGAKLKAAEKPKLGSRVRSDQSKKPAAPADDVQLEFF